MQHDGVLYGLTPHLFRLLIYTPYNVARARGGDGRMNQIGTVPLTWRLYAAACARPVSPPRLYLMG